MNGKGKVILKGLAFYGRHGVHPSEQLTGNRFEIDILVNVRFNKTAFHDQLEGTIDYKELYAIAKEEFGKTQRKLMEPIAHSIAKRILDTFDKATKATITISKLVPPIGGTCERATIEVNLDRENC